MKNSSAHTDDDDVSAGLAAIQRMARADPQLLLAMGNDWLATPDPDTARAASGELHGWTVQRAEVMGELNRSGIWSPDPRLVHPDRYAGYKLMLRAMERAGVPTSHDGGPVWIYTGTVWNETGYCDCACSDARLPVCDRPHVPPGYVALRVRFDGREAVVSDYMRWDFGPVRGFYIPGSDEDSKHFTMLLIIAGCPTTGRLKTKDWPEELRMVARASWQRVFELGPIPGMLVPPTRSRDSVLTSSDFSEQVQQACIASLALSNVSQVVTGPSAHRVDVRRWYAVHDSLTKVRTGETERSDGLLASVLEERMDLSAICSLGRSGRWWDTTPY